MQGIEIPIGAPLGQLDKDLKSATNQLKGFASQASTISNQIGNNVTKGASQASFALTNLGRVAQDAPFGFIGIQNNIQPLIESFQRLKTESGSTGGAIKALGQSLVGGGGLLLAVSLVTSALTVLAQNPDKVAGALNYLSGVVDNSTESQRKYNEELIKTQANAKVEIANINSLVSVAQNESLSRNARLEAIKKLKDEYPTVLGFLSLETIKSKEAASAINILSQSLLRKAKIQATEKVLGEAFVKQLEATTKSAVQQASTFSKVVGSIAGAAGVKNFIVLQNGIENQAKAFNEAQADIDNYTKILNKLNSEEAISGQLYDDKPEKIRKSTASLKTQSDILKELQIDLQKVANSVDITFGKGNEEKVRAYAKAIDGLTEIGAGQGIISKLQQDLLNIKNIDLKPVKSLGVTVATALGEGLASAGPVIAVNVNKPLKQGLTDWQLYVNNELLPKIQSNFETFFNNILMNGEFSFSSLAKAIKNTFLSLIASDAARQLTKLLESKRPGEEYTQSKEKGGSGLIGGAVNLIGSLFKGKDEGSAALKGIGGFLGKALPVAGIAIGAASILGSLFKKKQSAPIPQASSTISTSAAGSFQDFGGGRVVFEISGTNLIGVLNRAGAKLQRYGG